MKYITTEKAPKAIGPYSQAVVAGNFSRVNAIYEKYFGKAKPARSFVEVSNLPKNADIEIEVISTLNQDNS